MKHLPLIALLVALPALGQFRPPPLTEAQRLSSSGDQPRAEGSRLLAAGDKKGAETQFKKALDYYLQALKADPQLIVAAEGLGVVGNALGAHDQVIHHLAPVNAAHPKAADVAFNLGIAYFKSRRYEQAVPLLEGVRVGNEPSHLVAHYYLAQFHLATQRGDLAEVALTSYLALRPASVAGGDAEIQGLLGKAYVLQRRPAEARRAFELAQAGKPESAALQVGLATVLELEGKKKEAISSLEKLSGRFPKTVEVKERLARLLLEEQRLPEAERTAQALLALQGSANAHLLLAEVHLAQKRPAEAEAQARKALAVAPGLLPAQIRLGTALQAQGKHDEAVAMLETAVASSQGTSFDALAALGSANRRASRFQKAIEAHQQGLKLAPRYPPAHMLLAADYFAAGDWDRAIQHYSSVLQLVPADPRATHWLAYAYARRGKSRAAEANRLEDAANDLRRAFDLEGSGVMALNLATVLLDLDRYEEAVTVLGAGQTRKDSTWQHGFLMGLAQLGAGRSAEALQAFQAASASAPDADARAEVGAGAALALAAQGKLDEAVAGLEKGKGVRLGAALAQDNLPFLLYRRALWRVAGGAVSGAREDLAAADRLGGAHPDQVPLATLARALVAVEDGNSAAAAAGIKRARLEKVGWLLPGTPAVLTAYLHYRGDRFAEARKQATVAGRGGGPAARAASALGRAIQRREAEKKYQRGDYRGAEAALKQALRGEPNSPVLAVNLAAAQYAQRGAKVASAASAIWNRHAEAVPEAKLNLGVAALDTQSKVERAVGYFEEYVKSGGPRSSLVREWAERLRVLRMGSAVATEGGAL